MMPLSEALLSKEEAVEMLSIFGIDVAGSDELFSDTLNEVLGYVGESPEGMRGFVLGLRMAYELQISFMGQDESLCAHSDRTWTIVITSLISLQASVSARPEIKAAIAILEGKREHVFGHEGD